jgi:hypothetical protein
VTHIFYTFPIDDVTKWDILFLHFCIHNHICVHNYNCSTSIMMDVFNDPMNDTLSLKPFNPSLSNQSTIPPKIRVYNTFPQELDDVSIVGSLSAHIGDTESWHRTIQTAEQKLAEVTNGARKFGLDTVVTSFKPKIIHEYKLPAVLSNIFLFHTLCSSNIMETCHGMVSVFPLTIYTSIHALESQRGGYPVLCIHKAHVKTLIWRLFARTKNYLTSEKLSANLTDLLCEYDFREDDNLLNISGFDAFDRNTQRKSGGFMLLPAHVFDVLKWFFITPNYHVKDIGDLMRNIYTHVKLLKCGQVVFLSNVFAHEFRDIWLGVCRDANVAYMICDESKSHTFGMARLRSVNNQVRYDGRVWKLKPRKDRDRNYPPIAFAYGVECWISQLTALNYAWEFFTNKSLNQNCSHMSSLFLLHEKTPLLNRSQSLQQGVWVDREPSSSPIILRHRRELDRIEKTHGKPFIDYYFGEHAVRAVKY